MEHFIQTYLSREHDGGTFKRFQHTGIENNMKRWNEGFLVNVKKEKKRLKTELSDMQQVHWDNNTEARKRFWFI